MNIKVQIESKGRSSEVLGKLNGQLAAKLRIALKEAADHLFEKSQELVPVDSGALKASGQVSEGGVFPEQFAQVGYGHIESARRPDGQRPYDYAALVHDYMALPHTAPQQANFLGQPALDEMPQMAGIIVQVMEAQ